MSKNQEFENKAKEYLEKQHEIMGEKEQMKKQKKGYSSDELCDHPKEKDYVKRQ